MELWSILDIDPTDDPSIIKKAYARKLRFYHPEDDPQGYQKLRQAYDAALKYAKKVAKNKETGDKVPLAGIENQSPLSDTYPNENEIEFTKNHHLTKRNDNLYIDNIDSHNNQFMSNVQNLYNDFFLRIYAKNWETLLDSDLIWNIENKKTISRLMMDFLSTHRYLPQDVWILIDNNFHWCNRESNVQHYLNDDFIVYVKKQIERKRPLSYLFFKPTKGVDYEKFLECRENAVTAFAENNVSAANVYIEQAKRIYSDDPDLLLLEGQINLRNGNEDKAIQLFSKLLSIHPDNNDAYFYRATAYYEKNRIKESLQDYSRAYSKTASKAEIPLHIAKSYFQIGNLDKAKDWALKAQKIKFSSNEAKPLLSQIYANLRRTLTKELEKDPSNKDFKQKLAVANSEILKSNGTQSGSNKISSNTIVKLIKVLLKVLLYIILISIGIIIAFVTKVGVVVLIYFLVKYFKKKQV